MNALAGHITAHNRSPRAFTLIEILVSLAVFSIITTTVGSVFFYLYRDWKRQKDYMNVLQDSYWAVEALSSEMRQATDINNDTDPTSWRIETNYIPQDIWIWRGNRAGIENENDTFGYNGFLYRGYGNCKTSGWFCQHGAWEYRNILCRFITGYTYLWNATTNLVYINMTMRPQVEAPEGPLNRHLSVNMVIRRRN
jgi:prepilin-type N-terminal cleavage/methylation domain-containing protein